MQNGNYLIKDKVFGNEYRAVCYMGKIKVTTLEGKTILMPQICFDDTYIVVKKLPSEKATFNIGWYVNSKLKQIIHVNGSYAICKFKIPQMKQSGAYGMGKLIVIRADVKC